MAITNFIPTVWGETLYKELDKHYVAAKNSNRDYEGEIKNCGSSVNIVGVNDIAVYDYTANSDITVLDDIDTSIRTLDIDQAKYFNFQLDDVDRAQTLPGVMSESMRKAAQALANEADSYIYKTIVNGTTFGEQPYLSSGEYGIIKNIVQAREILYKNNVGSDDEVVLEVCPAIATILCNAMMTQTNYNNPYIESGCLGTIAGIKVFISNNIPKTAFESHPYYHAIMRTTRAVAFAEQLSEIEAYRPEKRFADAVKGLHLYGAKVVYPNELLVLKCSQEDIEGI